MPSRIQLSVGESADSTNDEHWARKEVDPDAFADARLGRRFGELLRQLGGGVGASIPLAC